MILTVEIPDAAVSALTESYGEMSRAMIESLATEGYRSGRLSSFTVGQMLGHESRWQTQDFLARRDAWPAQTVEEFERELSSVASLMTS
jgi:hypothetical protein